MTFNLLSLLNNINNKHYLLYHTMKNLSFEAKFNLKSEPNELIVEGSITTERPDDELIIEVSSDTSYIETMLLLEIKLKQGNGPMQDHRKTGTENLKSCFCPIASHYFLKDVFKAYDRMCLWHILI